MEALVSMERKKAPSIYCTDPNNLSYDEACLNVYTQVDLPYPLKLYYQYEECQNCEYMKWTRISSHTNNTSLIVKTTDRILFSVNDKGGVELCSQNYTFGQHGIYGFNISSDGCSPVFVMKSPDNPYYPLYVFLFCVILYLVLKVICTIFRKSQLWLRIQQGLTGTPQTDGQGTPTGDVAPLVPSELIPPLRQLQHTRINSLDTFRGITIALMIFVNYGGGKYWFFEHTTWNGLHVADVVFPWFAWIMGVGIALSVRSKLRSGLKRSTIIRGIFKRAVLLIFLGIFFSNRGNNNTLTLRIPGVLQRLGSSFLIVSFLESVLMKRQPDFQYGRWVILKDILDSWVQWITILFIVGVHTAVTFHLSVPGCPKGYLGPGGLHEHYQFVNCTGGAAGYIDRRTFGDNHIYQKPTSARIYHSDVPFDPEGLLGILTTTLTVYLGVAAGRIILCSNSTEGRIKRWASYAIVTGLIAGFLCDWSKEGGVIPINKNLWSLSFVCATASLAFCVLIFLYLIVDHYHLWSGKLFAQAGMNSILLYLGHGILKSSWPFSFTPINHTTHTQYFVEDLIGVLIWIFIAARLYKKEIFITV